jgi:hypothetical protein
MSKNTMITAFAAVALVLGAQMASAAAAEAKHRAGAHAYAAAPTYSVPRARPSRPYAWTREGSEPGYIATQDQFYRDSLGE